MKEFEKLVLKVGKVTEADNIPGMSKICKVKVDIGDRVAQAIAGGVQFYDPKSLVGKRVIVLANVEGRTIAGVKSEVMLLAADVQGKPIWLTVDEDVPPGTNVR